MHTSSPSHRTRGRLYTLDAGTMPLGRLASRVAVLLIGKHKPSYAPNREVGDAVVIKNAAKLQLTGKKMSQKVYYRYSGYLGGLKRIPIARLYASRPDFIIRQAVSRMLPKNKLRKGALKRLTIRPLA